ncbi:MAG TPA: hypothetical protein VJ617_05130 [Arthrobacter sp.]|nr:hypothetical protein [Arthrobacter sp.]
MTEPWELRAVELLDSVLDRLHETEDYAHAWASVDESGAFEAALAG